MDKNREFADLVGICRGKIEYGPHGLSCCDKCKEYHPANIPDYAADPRLVLREMKRIGKLEEFLRNKIYPLGSTGYNIPIDYLVDSNGDLETTGKLVKKAIEFLKEAKR